MNKEKILFIRINTPELIHKLTEMGYKLNKWCNEGIYLSIENGRVWQLNHVPYPRHLDFGENEHRFLIAAECLKLRSNEPTVKKQMRTPKVFAA